MACTSTMRAPMLSMFLMAVITGEVAYMPPKAVAEVASQGYTNPPIVTKAKRHTVNIDSPRGACRELNVSKRKTNKMRTSNPISWCMTRNCE